MNYTQIIQKLAIIKKVNTADPDSMVDFIEFVKAFDRDLKNIMFPDISKARRQQEFSRFKSGWYGRIYKDEWTDKINRLIKVYGKAM